MVIFSDLKICTVGRNVKTIYPTEPSSCYNILPINTKIDVLKFYE